MYTVQVCFLGGRGGGIQVCAVANVIHTGSFLGFFLGGWRGVMNKDQRRKKVLLQDYVDFFYF